MPAAMCVSWKSCADGRTTRAGRAQLAPDLDDRKRGANHHDHRQQWMRQGRGQTGKTGLLNAGTAAVAGRVSSALGHGTGPPPSDGCAAWLEREAVRSGDGRSATELQSYAAVRSKLQTAQPAATARTASMSEARLRGRCGPETIP